jgi:hypothetical protein
VPKLFSGLIFNMVGYIFYLGKYDTFIGISWESLAVIGMMTVGWGYFRAILGFTVVFGVFVGACFVAFCRVWT